MKIALTNLNFARRLQLCRYPCGGAFRAIECQLAQMNVFWHYCVTFSANDCVFSLNEKQKVYYMAHKMRQSCELKKALVHTHTARVML